MMYQFDFDRIMNESSKPQLLNFLSFLLFLTIKIQNHKLFRRYTLVIEVISLYPSDQLVHDHQFENGSGTNTNTKYQPNFNFLVFLSTGTNTLVLMGKEGAVLRFRY